MIVPLVGQLAAVTSIAAACALSTWSTCSAGSKSRNPASDDLRSG